MFLTVICQRESLWNFLTLRRSYGSLTCIVTWAEAEGSLGWGCAWVVLFYSIFCGTPRGDIGVASLYSTKQDVDVSLRGRGFSPTCYLSTWIIVGFLNVSPKLRQPRLYSHMGWGWRFPWIKLCLSSIFFVARQARVYIGVTTLYSRKQDASINASSRENETQLSIP